MKNSLGLAVKNEIQNKIMDKVKIENTYDKVKAVLIDAALSTDELRSVLEKIQITDEKIDFKKLLGYLNSATGRQFKVVSKSVKSKYRARLKEGYTKKSILNAIDQATKVTAHKENGFQYLTIEFFSRASTLDKYGYPSNKLVKEKSTASDSTNQHNNIPVG